MDRKDLYESIGGVNDTALAHSEKKTEKKRYPKKMAALAAVLALVLVSGLMLYPFAGGQRAYAISEAVYPEQVKRPGSFALNRDQKWDEWLEYVHGRELPEGSTEPMRPFLEESMTQFLSGAGESNRVCSPVNVYMVLAMLTDLTSGESRQQILDVLQSGTPEEVRRQANAVWRAVYQDDKKASSVLGNSIWLNETVPFEQAAMDSLAENYFASSYQGKMGSSGFDRAMQSWLNEQTGGLLKEQTGKLATDPETAFVLMSTIFCHAKWGDEFEKSNTRPDTFHAPGGDVTCDFMHERVQGDYYWGDRFGAVGKSLEHGETLWLLLPDKGVSVDELLQDEQALRFITQPNKWKTCEDNSKYVYINLALPKFDVTGEQDLKDGLKAMGVTDIFDREKADFTPMLTEEGQQQMPELWINKAQHDVRVTVDEEGITAAAYLELPGMGASAPPEDEVDFVLDRPFLFVYGTFDGLPLFAGVVNQP